MARYQKRGAAATTLVALSLALALCFAGGLFAMLGQIATAALMMAYALIGFAVLHTLDAGDEKPRAVAQRHLRRRAGIRLAGCCDGGLGPCRRRLRISPALSATEDARRLFLRPEFHPFNPNNTCSTQGDNTMEVILLERVAKLGQMGEVVRVKDGFARTFCSSGAARRCAPPPTTAREIRKA